MAKRRFQCWLSEGALVELERRAGAKDKRQAFLERWLMTNRELSGAEVERMRSVLRCKHEPEPDPVQAQTDRKAESASEAIAKRPKRTAMMVEAGIRREDLDIRAKQITGRSYCPTHRPKWCPDDCKHRLET